MFEVRGAGVRYGAVRALEAVDLRVERGERVALIGPSGAGKTTLIGLLNGSLTPAEGEVLVLGRDLARASPRERRNVQRQLGTVRQQFDLVGQLRVVHNVNAGRLGSWSVWRAALSLLAPREVDRARGALSRVGLEEKLYERTGDLSGGQQQRVAIARVLAQEPAAVLADEPIASVDPARAADVVNLMLGLSAETGTTLVVSLHDLPVALGHFDRIVALRAGQVAFDGAPDQLSESAIEDLYALDRRAG
jgi:phosphonate transport system ATP-binding protein